MSAFSDDDEMAPFLIANPCEDENIGAMDSQLDVNNGIALQKIDELCLEGKITATETAMYKARYIKLHSALKRSQDSVYKLHNIMKYCHSELERQEMELSKTEQFPENAVTEPLMMRAQIISTYNCAMETEERVETLSYEEALLREERKLLRRDFSRFPMSELEALGEEIDIFAEMERRYKSLQTQYQETFMEIDMMRLENKRSREQLRISKDFLNDIRLEHTESQLRLNRVKADCVLATALPGQYIKETEKARKYKSEIARNKEKVDLNKEQTEDLIRSFANWQDLEMVSRTEKYVTNMRLPFLFPPPPPSLTHNDNASAAFEKVRARLAVTPKYDNTLIKRKEKLNTYLQNLQSDIAEEEKRMAAENVHINQAVVLSERRLSLLERSRAENLELLHLATSLSEEMGRAVCEFNGAFRKHSRLAEDCQIKLRLIERQLEELETLETRLNDVSSLYMDAKKERNNCVSLLQAAVQVASATRERLRQRGNEAEILLTAAQRSEAQLSTVRSTTVRLVAQRDHKRHDLCKVAAAVAVQNAKREQMRLKLNRLTLMHNQAEASSIALKKACERNAKLRNERAILLIERNQEVYLLQEREKYQTIAMASAKMDLSGLEAEYQTSQLYLKHIRHMIHLLREQVPKKTHLEGSVHGLIQELIGMRAYKAQLVSWFEDPDRPGRLRLLGGVDPSQSELWIILGRLEKRLAAKEEDLAEKNLTYEAIGRLVDALRVKTDANRDDTFRMAMRVNGIQLRLLKLRKKLETKYAELIVSNFEQKKLQNEVRNRERYLDICMIRTLSEMPPSREIAREYRLSKRRERIRKEYKSEKTRGMKKILPLREPTPKLPFIGGPSDKIKIGRSPAVKGKSLTG
ncbi:hypothetical protein TcWFU_004809 [Taenia crassiceps]|uniref:Uncharacterized protein n=1 Tax=Taenia crassiceps TaxID=6207 RepID=A0ABR4Q203_9CEST